MKRGDGKSEDWMIDLGLQSGKNGEKAAARDFRPEELFGKSYIGLIILSCIKSNFGIFYPRGRGNHITKTT